MSVTVQRTDNETITLDRRQYQRRNGCWHFRYGSAYAWSRLHPDCRQELAALDQIEALRQQVRTLTYAYQMTLARALEREEQGGLRLPPNT
jgi:hypothetical protein